jgi:hypothetical protein
MGASADYKEIQLNVSNPRNQSEVKTATKSAWDRLVKERGYEYGHRGYTGTFAEKDGVVISYFPQLNDEEIVALEHLIMEAREYYVYKDGKRVKMPFSHQNLEDLFIVEESKWIKPYQQIGTNYLYHHYERNPAYVKMAKRKTPIYMLYHNNFAGLKNEIFDQKIPLPYNKLNRQMEALESAFRVAKQEGKDNEIKSIREKMSDLKKSPAAKKRWEIQNHYPKLRAGKNEEGLIYRKTYQKAKISIDNLTRMNKQWNDKWGNALAITNGSIVIFMGYCSS